MIAYGFTSDIKRFNSGTGGLLGILDRYIMRRNKPPDTIQMNV